MEKSEAIRRAVRLTPLAQPPADFTARLMERVEEHAAERTRRRERRETRLLTAGCICGFAALAVVVRAALIRMEVDLRLPAIRWPDWREFLPELPDPWPHGLRLHSPSLPELPFTGETRSQLVLYSCVAGVFFVLLIADLLIRRRLHASGRLRASRRH